MSAQRLPGAIQGDLTYVTLREWSASVSVMHGSTYTMDSEQSDTVRGAPSVCSADA